MTKPPNKEGWNSKYILNDHELDTVALRKFQHKICFQSCKLVACTACCKLTDKKSLPQMYLPSISNLPPILSTISFEKYIRAPNPDHQYPNPTNRIKEYATLKYKATMANLQV